MKVYEITSIPQIYIATVRLALRDSSLTARITITAETVLKAISILTHIYGDGNVLTINQVMYEDQAVTKATKTLSPQELQVKSLTDKADDYKQQAKAIKAGQQVAKAQQKLMKASRGPSAN